MKSCMGLRHAPIALALLLVSAVAEARGGPYLEVGVGYVLKDYSSHHVVGRMPAVTFEGGWEFSHRQRIGLVHVSRLRDGWPFNDNDELHYNEIRWAIRWGGAR